MQKVKSCNHKSCLVQGSWYQAGSRVRSLVSGSRPHCGCVQILVAAAHSELRCKVGHVCEESNSRPNIGQQHSARAQCLSVSDASSSARHTVPPAQAFACQLVKRVQRLRSQSPSTDHFPSRILFPNLALFSFVLRASFWLGLGSRDDRLHVS